MALGEGQLSAGLSQVPGSEQRVGLWLPVLKLWCWDIHHHPFCGSLKEDTGVWAPPRPTPRFPKSSQKSEALSRGQTVPLCPPEVPRLKGGLPPVPYTSDSCAQMLLISGARGVSLPQNVTADLRWLHHPADLSECKSCSLLFFFKLKCSLFTVLCWVLLYSKIIQLQTYIHSFYNILFHHGWSQDF